jgi:hypothetical protein
LEVFPATATCPSKPYAADVVRKWFLAREITRKSTGMNIDRKTPIGKAVDTSHGDDRPEVEGHRIMRDPLDRKMFGEDATVPESEPEVEGHRRLPPMDRKMFGEEAAVPEEDPEVEGHRRF